MATDIKYCTGDSFSDSKRLKNTLWENWKEIFNDDDSYINLFFRDKYRPNRVFCATLDNQIVSCVHSVPYAFKLFGELVNSTYITAVNTLPEYRGQGIYPGLFDYYLNQAAKQNIVLTTLIVQEKWLFIFYKRLGYSDIFKKKHTRLYQSSQDVDIEIYTSDALYDYYEKHFLSAQFRPIHSRTDFETILKFLAIYDGSAFVAYDSDKNITGAAFVTNEDGELLILELICNNEIARENLVNQICSKYSVKSVNLAYNSNEADANRFGMIRIIKPHKLLEVCAAKYPNLQLQLSIIDAIVKDNSGTYTISDGYCNYSTEVNKPISIDEVLPRQIGRAHV